MDMALMVVGGYMLIAGSLLLVRPELIKQLVERLRSGTALRLWGIVPGGVGLLLFWAAPASRSEGLIQVLGGLAVIKGLYLCAAPRAQVTRLMSWWLGRSPGVWRAWALLSLGLGALVLMMR